jgi:hypothetical protein
MLSLPPDVSLCSNHDTLPLSYFIRTEDTLSNTLLGKRSLEMQLLRTQMYRSGQTVFQGGMLMTQMMGPSWTCQPILPSMTYPMSHLAVSMGGYDMRPTGAFSESKHYLSGTGVFLYLCLTLARSRAYIITKQE